MKSYRILHYRKESYKIVLWDGYGILDKHERTPHNSYRIWPDPKQNPIKSLLILVKILRGLRQDFERLNSILLILDKMP